MSLTRLITTRVSDPSWVHHVRAATRGGAGTEGGTGRGEDEGEGGTGLACERTILNEIYSGGQDGGRDYTKRAARF